MGNRFNELIQMATQVNIISVCDDHGIPYKELRDEYRLRDHGIAIYKLTNRFHWFSKELNGNTIDFCREYLNMEFKEALSYLTQQDFKIIQPKVKKKKSFHYYFKHDTNFDQVYNYLVYERKIDAEIVKVLHKKGYIQQDMNKQCIFVWAKDGQPVGATIQGTIIDYQENGKRGTIKKIAYNSKSNFGFNVSLGVPTKLYIFESSIDLLSYWTLNKNLKNCMLASAEGTKEKAVYNFMNYMYLSKKQLPVNGVYIGSDNDATGQKMLEKFIGKSFIYQKENEEHLDITFFNNVPNDSQISQRNIDIYQKICREVTQSYSDERITDWRFMAAIHKAITNLSEKNILSNNQKYDKYFGDAKANSKNAQIIDLEKECKKLSHAMQQSLFMGKLSVNRLLDQKNNLSGSMRIRNKVDRIYETYCLHYEATMASIKKDWNNVLQDQSRRYSYFDGQETYARVQYNNGKLNIFKKSSSDKKEELFFEADSAKEMDFLLKNYGFYAMDKEDFHQYKQEQKQKMQLELTL